MQLDAEQRNILINKMMGGESLYVVNPLEDTYATLYRNRYLSETYGDNECFSESISKYIGSDVHPLYRERMLKATDLLDLVANLTRNGECVEEYIDISSGRSMWYRMRARKLSDEEILLGFANKDKEIADSLILDKIQEDYFAMFGVNLDEERMKVLKKPTFYSTAEEGDSVPYQSVMATFASTLTGDARIFFNHISDISQLKRMLENEDKISYAYKSDLGDGSRWVNMIGYVVMRHDDGSPFLFSLGFSLMDAESSEKEERQLTLAHDLRTTADAISGLTSMAKEHAGEREKVLDCMEKIDVSVRQLLRLVDQAL